MAAGLAARLRQACRPDIGRVGAVHALRCEPLGAFRPGAALLLPRSEPPRQRARWPPMQRVRTLRCGHGLEADQ